MQTSYIVLITMPMVLMSLAILSQSAVPTSDSHSSQFVMNGTQPPRNSTRIIKRCDEVPTLCSGKGSPGPQCCNKQCINLQNNKFHCGKCGAKCRFSEICCGGKCVNPLSDDEHCGECNKGCSVWKSCTYGMCAYAD